MVNEFMMTLKG